MSQAETAGKSGRARRRATVRNRVSWLAEGTMLALGLVVIYPLAHLFLSSLKEPDKVFDPFYIPDFTFWGNYEEVFRAGNFLISFGNTVFLTTASIGLVAILSSMAGHAISRAGKGLLLWIYFLLLSGMIIPAQTTMIPIFKLAVAFGLIDTRFFMILMYTAGVIPFATFIYAGFVKSIPRELEEAAAIDGCGRWRTYWTIVFPLLMPATGTIIVTNIFGMWSDLLGPLLYLYSPEKQTLMTLIFSFKQERTTDWGPVFALSVIATIPLILLFLFVQKQFIRGLTSGALKG
ncbi:carbohydrate ABC transporter permease [Cohnella silvisoli]|uniref:Carbohydrate ABC transporter permease n=1 Tax=Cohnella silvisoli TaxID=2873699 RepID=A0ABV1KWH9_9BACL|nr:carbohydrate ABC transporter permease [Cohnella silvisoli]MCD9023734.1 carbohydrate ABC transporter permease [Cohnella silvisoli]